MRLITFQNATFLLQGKPILSKLTFEIRKREHLLISGDNGSGKTTFCRALARKLRTASGQATFTNLDFGDIQMITFTDAGSLFHSVNNLHYYQQRFNSWDSDGHLTMRDYLKAKGINTNDKKSMKLFAQLKIDCLIDRERIKLSSGQTRKMLLASAILRAPKVLILDNAYIGLDGTGRRVLNHFLDDLVKLVDLTLIISGQATDLPKCIKKELRMSCGQIESFKPISSVATTNSTEFENDTKKVGKKPNTVDVCLSMKNINVAYKGESVLSNLSWEVKNGERWVVTGHNGSGKSTLVSLIYADHPQLYSQDIKIMGLRPGRGVSIWDIKKRIGFTSPELHAYVKTGLTCSQVVATGLWDKLELMGDMSSDQVNRIDEMLNWFELKHLSQTPYQFVSTGEQCICLFLRALIKHPPILLLDEPFQGLDNHNIEIAKNILREKFKEQTLLFISHHVHEYPENINGILEL